MVDNQRRIHPVAAVLGLAGWSIGGFVLASLIVGVVVELLGSAGVNFSGVNESVFGAVVAAVAYSLALVIVIGVPWLLARSRTTLKQVGLQRLPSWSDLGLAPLAFVAYLITSGLVIYFVSEMFPAFDAGQSQDVGFGNLIHRYEYILAFVTLVVIAPFAEEVLFRGYLFGKLKKYIPWWGAALLSSVVFGLAHGQLNVAIDTFVLGMFMCGLREISGSLWPAITLHMIKNGIAYYFLFINPEVIRTLVN